MSDGTGAFRVNAGPDRQRGPSVQDLSLFGDEAARRVATLLRLCPAYEPTPLVPLPEAARVLGVGSVLVKDEAARLGLGSFKALGGAFAVIELVLDRAATALGRSVEADELLSQPVRQTAAGLVVVCATDGNHGRSVAAGARLVGCRAVIYVHEGVSAERAAAIARFGAEVVRCGATYDDSVRAADAAATLRGWNVVSDTSWDGYEATPARVMQGYTAIVEECIAVFADKGAAPTHVFLQAGVGGFAAAIAARMSQVMKPCPKFVIVEPDRAACLLASSVAGRPTRIEAGEPSIMAMLECYEPSRLAWRLLSGLADVFMTVSEAAAMEAVRALARLSAADRPIVAGESGAAGFAGLLTATRSDALRAAVGLARTSRVLLFNTEGATDPATLRASTGIDPELVAVSSVAGARR